MNTARLKEFAPAARRSLLASVKGRAMIYGITSDKPDRALDKEEGDLVRINGILYPKDVQREWISLAEKVEKEGFEPVMEQAAYTWFNRLAALRYMEVHGYLDHKRRVLSHPEGGLRPEILEHAHSIDIPGLKRSLVLELLADGSKSEELYQYLLLQQCWALHDSLPLLFENLEPAIRLLIPDNLLAPNSIIRSFVDEIPEEDWRTTEILGWLYQFYVLEQKQRVDAYVKQGKAVEPEDIPAKTQLFTPNWIVQFLTQNSLGRLWMDVYPDSPLREKMPYFTPPAEQEPEVSAKLKEITPESLDPKTLTAIDPAAGSGHILLELYSLFFEMYQEQGYPPQQIPRLILENNLHGLELDRRAAQIAGFSLLMRARADDPQLLSNPPKVKVLALRHSRDLDLSLLLSQKQAEEVFPSDRLFEGAQPRLAAAAKPLFSRPSALRKLKELFEEADVFGSLIRVPEVLSDQLQALAGEVASVRTQATLLDDDQLDHLEDLIRQAQTMAGRYTACVANPPYLGGKAMVKELKEFAQEQYPTTKSDLFAMFMARGFDYAEKHGFNAMVTMQSWMFLSSYEKFRQEIVENKAICSMVHMGNGVMGIAFGTAATSIRNIRQSRHVGTYCYAESSDLDASNRPKVFPVTGARLITVAQDQFKKIPGFPTAYWLEDDVRLLFSSSKPLSNWFTSRLGMSTADNDKFVKLWHEVSFQNIGFHILNQAQAIQSGKRWFPYMKGGSACKWYGNQEYVVDWEGDGKRIRNNIDDSGRIRSHNYNDDYAFRLGITWSDVTSGVNTFRLMPRGFMFDGRGSAGFPTNEEHIFIILALLNSGVSQQLLNVINPTVVVNVGEVVKIPFSLRLLEQKEQIDTLVSNCVDLSSKVFNYSEASWCFDILPCLFRESFYESLTEYGILMKQTAETLRSTESELSVIIEECYPRSLAQLTQDRSSVGNSGLLATKPDELANVYTRSMISYFIGCFQGRYSLDEPGLIYAHAGGEPFDPSRYKTFPADEDGILPLTDQPYFGEEDTAERLAQWVKTVWSESPLEENLALIAANLGPKEGESSMETIRRYLVEDFYSDHLQTYKKRPIYWLFSSGKKRAFQALVYLHRYQPGTLGRLRSQYVLPLIGKLQAQVDMADQSAADPSATASQKSQRSREAKKLKEQLAELLEFDTRLLHYANKAIALDLDDGVKVNYGKFSEPGIGDILAKVKEITGGKDD